MFVFDESNIFDMTQDKDIQKHISGEGRYAPIVSHRFKIQTTNINKAIKIRRNLLKIQRKLSESYCEESKVGAKLTFKIIRSRKNTKFSFVFKIEGYGVDAVFAAVNTTDILKVHEKVLSEKEFKAHTEKKSLLRRAFGLIH